MFDKHKLDVLILRSPLHYKERTWQLYFYIVESLILLLYHFYHVEFLHSYLLKITYVIVYLYVHPSTKKESNRRFVTAESKNNQNSHIQFKKKLLPCYK